MIGYVYWVHLKGHNISTDGYVGVTKNTKIRWYKHKKDLSCKHFSSAILKYKDLLIWEVVFEGPMEGCYHLENYFRPKPCVGWNIAIGGAVSPNLGRTLSASTRKKISEANKGNKPWWLSQTNTIHTKEAIEKRKATVTKEKTFAGKNNPMYGKTHTKEARDRIGKAHKGKEGYKGKDNPTARSIICVDTGEVFDTISEAACHVGCTMQNISLCLRGKGKTAKGFSWKYTN